MQLGFLLEDLIPVTHSMKAANSASIRIDGAILLKLEGHDSDNRKHCAAVMVYVSPDSKKFYLSREAMVQLGIISHDFPQVGAALPMHSECNAANLDASSTSCGCEERGPPPGRPTELPFEATDGGTTDQVSH